MSLDRNIVLNGLQLNRAFFTLSTSYQAAHYKSALTHSHTHTHSDTAGGLNSNVISSAYNKKQLTLMEVHVGRQSEQIIQGTLIKVENPL